MAHLWHHVQTIFSDLISPVDRISQWQKLISTLPSLFFFLGLKAPRSSVSAGQRPPYPPMVMSRRLWTAIDAFPVTDKSNVKWLVSFIISCFPLCVFSSPPRKNFTSSVAVSPACHWSCKHCSQLSSQISAHCSSEASCWTPLTCWLRLRASSRCSMKGPPSKYPAAQQSSVLRISHEWNDGSKKIQCGTE